MRQSDAPLVVQILTRLGAGGPPVFVVRLARELGRRGFRSVLVTGSCDTCDGDMSYLLEADDRVYWVDEMSRSVSPWKDLAALYRMTRYLRRVKPAIVHTHTAKAGTLGRLAAKLAGVPVVVHTFHGNVLKRYFSQTVSRGVVAAERMLARMTDRICVLSEQQARELTEELRVTGRGKVEVTPLGMDFERLRGMPKPDAGEGFTVLWMGRFVAIKDLALLVRAAERTLAAHPGVRFLIAGDGPERKLVESACARFGGERFRWIGWQQEIGTALRLSHAVALTSRNEGTPLCLMEGMAAGRPFISTGVGGVADMVRGAAVARTAGARWHENGILCDADAEAFSRAIGRLADEPELYEEMSGAAARHADEHYGLDRAMERLTDLYDRLLQREPGEGRSGHAQRLERGKAGELTKEHAG